MRIGVIFLFAMTLGGCASQDPAVKLLTSSRWAKDVSTCSHTYLTFDRSRITLHKEDAEIPLLEIIQAVRNTGGAEAVDVGGRPSGALLAKVRRAHPEMASARTLNITFRVTESRLSALVLVAGDKGELGGFLDPSDPVYANFDLRRCPA